MSGKHRALTLIAFVIASFMGSARAGAQSDAQEQRARVHVESGRQYYEEGRFARAAEEFERAHELSGKADLLYIIFFAQRDAGRLEEATKALQAYLAEVSGQPNRSKLEARLATMQAQLERRRAEDDGAAPDRDASSEQREDEASEIPLGPIATMGGGGTLLLGALVTGILAKKAESDLDAACPGRVGCDPADESIRDRMKRLGVATDVLWITGAAAAAGGLVWFLLARDGSEVPEEPALSFGCGPGSCGVAYRGEF